MTGKLSFPCRLRGPVAADHHSAPSGPPLETTPPRHPSARPVPRIGTFHHRSSGGFSLIEMVLVMLILGIIAAAISKFALQGIRSYSAEQDRGDAHSQARLAVERVVREARAIRSCADIVGPTLTPSATLSFTDSTGVAVDFTVAGGNLTRNGAGNLLARGVTSAQPFSFLDMNGAASNSCPAAGSPSAATDIWFVEIDLTSAQGSESLRLRTRVHPRNFQ